MEGHQIGAYRIERKLGEGGMGVVWVGVDVRLGRRAAIKQLLPEMSGNRDIVERFFNEAKAAASINHPGIVEVYDVGWHQDGSAYFAMKLLEGQSLARRMRDHGPMSVMLAATIARQVASALAAAHARGIVHRDLKPDNVVLVADDEVSIGERATVLDFGIAKLFGDRPMSQKTRTGSVMGTPSYMSPEQCRGAGEVDHRTDVYALGCILFEMLTGRPPFVGEGAGEVLGMHQFVESPTVRSLRADVPPAFEAVVMRALAKRPEHRHQSMAELTAALQPFATARASLEQPAMSAPVSHPPTSYPHAEASTYSAGRGEVAAASVPPREPTRGRRGLLIGAGLTAVLGLGITIAVIASRGGGDQPAAPQTAAAAVTDAASIEAAPAPAVVIDAAPAPAAIPAPDAGAAADPAIPTHEVANAEALRAFQQAYAEKDFAAAAKHVDAIAEGSMFKSPAVHSYGEMRKEFVEEKKDQARLLARDGKCDALAALAEEAGRALPEAKKAVLGVRCKAKGTATATAPRPDKPDGPPEPARSADDLIQHGKAAFVAGRYAEALRDAEQALRASPTADERAAAASVAGMAACYLKNAAKAKRYLAMVTGPSQSMMRQRCVQNGVTLD